MRYQDLWPAIQKDIRDVILADDFLGARAGVAVEPGDPESVINAKITKAVGAGFDGKNGVGFLVLPIERADDDNVSLPGGPLKLTISIQWVENVPFNNASTGTGIPIRVYAAACEKLLKLYTPVGLTQSLVPGKPVLTEFTDNINKSLRVGMVEFTAVEADFKPFLRLNRPAITVTGGATQSQNGTNDYQLTGNATVSVAFPALPNGVAATIYYTTDGSHPYPGNPDATQYNSPVNIIGPGLFRVRAFAPGYAGSDTAAVNFWQ